LSKRWRHKRFLKLSHAARLKPCGVATNSTPTKKASSMFEITKIAAKDTFILELTNANDEPLKDDAGTVLSVTVWGPGSKAHQKATAARTQRMMDMMAKKGKVKLSAENQLKETAEFLAACTVSFNGWTYGGDATAFQAAYADPSIGFIADQVAKAIGDWANFTSA
jgi:hypothetical protein